MRIRRLASGLTILLLASGCVADAKDQGATEDGGKDTGSSESQECLNRVAGSGDLEVTDSAFSVLNPAASEEGYSVTWAAEVTNSSNADTAMVAGYTVKLVDSDGKQISVSESDGFTEVSTEVEYIAPGKKRLMAGTFEGVKDRPNELKIKLGNSASFDTEPATYWWPHEVVTYPPELKVSDIEVKNAEKGGKLVFFEITNGSDKTFQKVSPVTVLRDDKGKLVGGQFSGPFSMNAYEEINVPKGRSEASLVDSFPFGFPKNTDVSKIEIQLTNSPEWATVDKDCKFDFEP